MGHNNTVWGDMLHLLPRHVFGHRVETHSWQGPQPRKFSFWSQLVAMTQAHLRGKKSLRDLVFSLGRHVKQLHHLGLDPVNRSTLADANEQRPARIFAGTYMKLRGPLGLFLSHLEMGYLPPSIDLTHKKSTLQNR